MSCARPEVAVTMIYHALTSESHHVIHVSPALCWTSQMAVAVESLAISFLNHEIPFTSGLAAAILIF